ncbi:MAG: hypothetical protein ACI83O_000501 [Patescibacteria group bacterium]
MPLDFPAGEYMDLKDYIEEAAQFTKQPQLSQNSDLNDTLPFGYLTDFSDGSNYNYDYKWTMQDRTIDLTVEKENTPELLLLSLSPEEHKKFAISHAEYVLNEKNSGHTKLNIEL